MAGNMRAMSLLVTLVLATVFGISSAKTIVVGGTTGWTIPPTPSLYSNFASKQKVQVGDVLVFNFPAGAHTVAEVSKANYDSCATTSTIGPVLSTSPANINITKSGTHYFICTITGHCSANQKLTITATALKTLSPSPSPSPSPSDDSSPSPTSLPLSPTVAGPIDGPATTGGGAGSSPPPPAGNFAASTVVGGLSLVAAIVASAILF